MITKKMTPKALRKQLLMAESEINRAQLVHELGIAKIGTQKVMQQVIRIGGIVSTIFVAVASLRALRKGSGSSNPKEAQARKKTSFLKKIFNGVRVASSLKKKGVSRWEKSLREVIPHLAAAFRTDDLVIGGGSARLVSKLPRGTRRGSNELAFVGGGTAVEQSHPP